MERTAKYTFHVGLETADGDRVDPEQVKEALKDHFRGANIAEEDGIWEGDSEPALRAEHVALGDFSDEDAQRIKAALEDRFNQDVVLVEKDTVEVLA